VLLLEKDPSYLTDWRLNDSRAGLDHQEKEKILFLMGIKLRFQGHLSLNIVTKVNENFWLLVENEEEKCG
jgi:hypothetical protein